MLPKMHPRSPRSYSTLRSFSLKTLSAAVLATTLISSASAAGLGRLTVLSALGQPLNAEIELTSVGKDEAGSLFAKLASAEAFRQANIDFNPALFSVRFGIEQRGARQFIRVTSSQPINEPFVDMLLELGGTNGRLVREYTFLLDPSDMRSAQVAAPVAAPVTSRSAPVSTPAPTISRAPAAVDVAPAPARPSKPAKARAEEPPPVDVASGDKTYTVKRGDSLAKIANQVRSRGVSLDQMLVALYRANPTAFVGENMNRMRSGQILTVPSTSAAQGLDQQEARGVVVAQAQDFSNYRNKLAGQVAATAPQKTAPVSQAAGGKITTKVEEQKNPADESKDKLKLSKAGALPASGSAKGAAVSAAEDKIAKDKAIEDANTRVKQLEKNVADLQKVLEVKNKDLADQQHKAELASKTNTAAVTAPIVAGKPASAALVPNANVTAALKPDDKKPAPPVVVTPPVVAAAPVTAPAPSVAPVAATTVPAPVPTPAPAPTVKPVDAPAVAAATVKAPAKTPVAAPLATPKVKPPVVAAPETSWVDDLLGNALLLPGLGLALVGLGAFGIYSSRRKKKSQQFEDSILTDSNLKANSLFGSTGGQSVDTNNSVFNSNFAPSASQLDANEVDPVAEADVYIAYGRDAQAEEILKEALRTQPERNAVRLKLLEIYSHRKDSRAFELMASELYALTKGQGDDWAQAASMGLALDPSNPMYAGAKPVVAAPLHAAVSAPAHASGDDLDLEALLASTQANTLAGAMNTISPEVTHHMDEQKLDANTASYFDAGASEAAKHAASTAEHHAHATGEHGLDFDLEGLGVQDVESKEVLIDPAKLTADDHHAHDLPFNLDPSHKSAAHDIEAVEFTEAHAVASSPVIATAPLAAAAHDGAMEFHLPPLDAVTAASPDAPDAPDAAAHVATAEALHLPTEHAMQPPVEAAAPVMSATHPAPMDFDLSGISLDLDPDASHATAAPATVGTAPVVHHHDLAHESADTLVLEDDEISTTPEMATKLDLAIAYEEIGDKEGARELLDEVVKGGSSEQVAQAKAMLVKLG